jgi:uncharacterized membrane protein (DUF106 family)
MKSLKDEIKELQKEMKMLKDNPKKMMEVNKRAMETNMKYMTQSMKPMLFTFIPIIIIFGWMNAHLAFDPIMPGQEFTMTLDFEKGASGMITAEVPEGLEIISNAEKEISDRRSIFTFKGDEPGVYSVGFSADGKTYTKEVEITNERSYFEPVEVVKDDFVRQITTDHDKAKAVQIGGFGLTWLWTYIIFSVIFSISLRRLLKIY